MTYSLILTCEHAGNQVPDEYKSLFENQDEVLQSHRGWDPGAWLLANFLSKKLEAPIFGCLTTRLLIEANRSVDNVQLFSEFTSSLKEEAKEKLIQEIYKPYRDQVQKAIDGMIKPVLHLSIHSFTPIWDNQERKVDIGILFDPSQDSEASFSNRLKENLQRNLPGYLICFNEPYKGTDDGITTWMRKKYKNEVYTGIEIEVNQKFSSNLSFIESALSKSIKESIKQYTGQP
jgi:predicted N-formylglutamate amidohydrolase